MQSHAMAADLFQGFRQCLLTDLVACGLFVTSLLSRTLLGQFVSEDSSLLSLDYLM